MILSRLSLLLCIVVAAQCTPPHHSPPHHSMTVDHMANAPPMMAQDVPVADSRSDPVDIIVEDGPSDMVIENQGALGTGASGNGAAAADIPEEDLLEILANDENLLADLANDDAVLELLAAEQADNEALNSLPFISQLGGLKTLGTGLLAGEAAKIGAIKGLGLTGKALVKAGLLLKAKAALKAKIDLALKAKAIGAAKIGGLVAVKKLLLSPLIKKIGLIKAGHFGLKSLIHGKKAAVFGAKAAAGSGLVALSKKPLIDVLAMLGISDAAIKSSVLDASNAASGALLSPILGLQQLGINIANQFPGVSLSADPSSNPILHPSLAGIPSIANHPSVTDHFILPGELDLLQNAGNVQEMREQQALVRDLLELRVKTPGLAELLNGGDLLDLTVRDIINLDLDTNQIAVNVGENQHERSGQQAFGLF